MTWTSETIMQTIQTHMLNDCISNEKLVTMTGLKPNQVESATQNLHKNGFIKRTEPGCYRITQAGIIALDAKQNMRSGPKGETNVKIHKNTLRVRIWRAIRIRKSFSIPELEGIVATGDEKDVVSNIGKYLRALETAGYLIRMGKKLRGSSLTSNGFLRWRLDPLKDTGPQAPIWRQSKGTLLDPNTGEEISLAVNKEVAA
jgi:predicted transcriptional regulator